MQLVAPVKSTVPMPSSFWSVSRRHVWRHRPEKHRKFQDDNRTKRKINVEMPPACQVIGESAFQ